MSTNGGMLAALGKALVLQLTCTRTTETDTERNVSPGSPLGNIGNERIASRKENSLGNY